MDILKIFLNFFFIFLEEADHPRDSAVQSVSSRGGQLECHT